VISHHFFYLSPKLKKKEKKTPNKIERKKIKPKEKYNRVQPIVHNF